MSQNFPELTVVYKKKLTKMIYKEKMNFKTKSISFYETSKVAVPAHIISSSVCWRQILHEVYMF